MSNLKDTDGVNPMVFDTVGATSAIARQLRILAIVWDSGQSGAAKDSLAIHDKASGNLILSATLASANDTLRFNLGGVQVNGFYLTTMTHGTLYVYLK